VSNSISPFSGQKQQKCFHNSAVDIHGYCSVHTHKEERYPHVYHVSMKSEASAIKNSSHCWGGALLPVINCSIDSSFFSFFSLLFLPHVAFAASYGMLGELFRSCWMTSFWGCFDKFCVAAQNLEDYDSHAIVYLWRSG
jgi:hypothetical protein